MLATQQSEDTYLRSYPVDDDGNDGSQNFAPSRGRKRC